MTASAAATAASGSRLAALDAEHADRPGRCEIVVELVDERHAGRNVELDDIASLIPSRCLTSARRLLPCAGDEHDVPRAPGRS